MPVYKNGSSGNDVALIQTALKKAGLYEGEPDGVFGNLTEAAVKDFQSKSGLAADGITGPATWAILFPPDIKEDISLRCLALTGSFETGQLAPDCFATVTGNFDGQGMSFGALQWNFGQGTLQPLFQEMFDKHPDISFKIFGDDLESLQNAIKGGKDSAIAFAVSSQKTNWKHWMQMFRLLGLTSEFQAIETKGAAAYQDKAVRLCKDYGLRTARGIALMFDIAVQNGGISDKVRGRISDDTVKLGQGLSPEDIEVAKMKIIANRRAEAANPRFIEDVRRRKLCIAEGKGVVHGIAYDLAVQFGLDLSRVNEL
jgi:hypothetical protein